MRDKMFPDQPPASQAQVTHTMVRCRNMSRDSSQFLANFVPNIRKVSDMWQVSWEPDLLKGVCGVQFYICHDDFYKVTFYFEAAHSFGFKEDYKWISTL